MNIASGDHHVNHKQNVSSQYKSQYKSRKWKRAIKPIFLFFTFILIPSPFNCRISPSSMFVDGFQSYTFQRPSKFKTFFLMTDNKNNGETSEEITYFSPNIDLSQNKRYQQTLTSSEEESDVDDASNNSMNEYSFFDEAIIYVRAGSGGQGASTYKKGKKNQDSAPDGGDGGNGGDVYVVSDKSLNTLAGLTMAWRPNSFGGGGGASLSDKSRIVRPMSFRAENGQDGGRQFKNGKYAQDVFIRVPPGTVVQEEIDEFIIDPETGDKEVTKTTLVDIGSVDAINTEVEDEDLSKESTSSLLVAQGGMGGEGTGVIGIKGGGGRGVRRTRASPVGGERKRLKLTLKIVADVALVGVPNAGKSTFLASVTRAKPKIANVSINLCLITETLIIFHDSNFPLGFLIIIYLLLFIASKVPFYHCHSKL